MKKGLFSVLFTMAASWLFLSCGQKTSGSDSSDVENTVQTPETEIVWIEDKPGPTLQGRNIFPTVPDSLWESLGLQEGVPSSISCFLLKADGKNILVDAGLGLPNSMLQSKLAESGVCADSLELIFITHMHGDHIGGMLAGDEIVFPNAEVYINRVEAEAWLAMSDDRSAQAKKVLDAYKEHLHYFEAGDTLPGGVVSMAAYGHTPGHTVFQKDSILIIADLMHGAALQLEHPEYCPFFDMDPEAATEARVRILEYARQNQLIMYGMHLPAPGSIQLTIE